ncbi:MAG: cytochrome c oxidase subunit II [Deltaproteobacteria bacterium]|nr:cytochrome c oxidase subunit II [Deltaproteobacteria bacterium]
MNSVYLQAALRAGLVRNDGGTFWMPPQASTVASGVDETFYFIYYLSVFFFIVIVAAMAFFALRYRFRSEKDRTSGVTHHTGLEIVWSVIPSILLLAIFLWGFTGFVDLSVPPGDALNVRVTGQKWLWSFSYPDAGVTSNELVVPEGRAVKLTMSSRDVIHSFYVPDFRVKRDVLPNRYTVVWFKTEKPGEHHVFCAEYCGTNHSRMLTKVRVLARADYDKWLAETASAGEGMDPVAFGEQLFTQKGCNACHTVDGTKRIGPPLNGIFGHTVGLIDGTSVTVDDNYLRQSLMDPASQVVQGFAPVMPPFKGQLKDKEVDALIDYIKSLKE